MFEWKDEYATGIPGIDAQHKNLFAAARELHAALSAGQAREMTSSLLDRLIQYTVAHFQHEEELMERHRYPELFQHRAEHEDLKRQAAQFRADFAAGKTGTTIRLLPFLSRWLEHHILGSDLKYAAVLRGRIPVAR